MTDPVFTIRSATLDDAREIARLLTLLGHASTADSVREAWARWPAAGEMTLVAVGQSAPFKHATLLGVATLNRMMVLHRPYPVGRITSLIVDAPWRGAGIGRALVAAAEAVLKELGCGLLEVTSNDRLVEAHRFYEHLGYQRTSIRLAKSLTE